MVLRVLCADILGIFCAISPVYVQIPVIIEDFPLIPTFLLGGGGSRAYQWTRGVRLRVQGKECLCIFTNLKRKRPPFLQRFDLKGKKDAEVAAMIGTIGTRSSRR